MAEGFVHLHLHTEYSLLDGSIRIHELADRLVELGMKSCAITDHGSMFGVVDFYKTMTAKGIHPIIGCEVYVAPDSRFDKNTSLDGRNYNHLILLAKNNEGLRNLNRLVSAGYTEGFYRKPRIDKELLEMWHDGLICLSACLAGKLSELITAGKVSEAVAEALWYDDLFGRGNYYLEIQSNTMPEQSKVNATLVKISNQTGIPLVATNDCHYLNREDSNVHDVLLCMQTGSKLSDENRMRMQTDDFYLKSETEMRRFFSEIPEALANTVRIAEMCQAEFDFNTIHLPEYDIPEGFTDNKMYLSHLTSEGLKKRFEISGRYAPVEEYVERAKYELSVINSMGYTDYYLIVWDFIAYAKNHGIMVGPGRGSGAGSLVAYAIGITNIDPLRYSLVFERFLNAERVSMPDFDVDFCVERREEVIRYVTAKYGAERVSQVISFGTLAARLCIRDVARVLDLPYAVADKVAKMIPENNGITISQALEINTELKAEYDNSSDVKKVLDIAIKLEGMPRHTSTHAAGVIISGKPITDIAPLATNDNVPVVQFAKADIESVGLLKFDFLGLRTLTVLREAADMVEANYGKRIEFDAIPLDDPNIFKMIGAGDTVGVFQLESKGMTSFMKDLKPTSLEDIIAGISLYRPGPMDQIPRYVECKHNPGKIKYDHPLLEPILNVTYGCMVYQEQVMQIVRDLAGFSMGQSDNIRRAMSKKKKAMMEKYRQLFIYGGVDEENGKTVKGAVNNGVPAEIADKIYNDVSNFAGYAFNKSHAAAYAVVGYYTAYFKYYYPTEFMAAMLNSFRFSLGQASWYIRCCTAMGINVLPPDVNKSKAKFTTEGDRSIRIGLSMLKNVGEAAVVLLTEDRYRNGEYKSFEDFISRSAEIGMKKNMLESLIYSSALDWTGLTRSSMIATVQTELDKISGMGSRQMDGQMSLFGMSDSVDLSMPSIRIVKTDEYPSDIKLAYEKEYVGMYMSGHPLMAYENQISKLVTFDTKELKDVIEADAIDTINDEKVVVMCGMLQSKKVRYTKKKTAMGVMIFEDLYGQFEAAAFGKVLEDISGVTEVNKPYIVVGRRRLMNEDSFSLSVDAIFPMPTNDFEVNTILGDRRITGRTFSRQQYNAPVTRNAPEMEVPVQSPGVNSGIIRIKYKGSATSEAYQRLLNFLVYFHGNLPVEIEFTSDGSVLRLAEVCNFSSDPEMILLLKDLCGDENVIL